MPAKAVIDTNIVIRANIHYPKHRAHQSFPAYYQLVDAFHRGFFTWLWNEEILAEYREGFEDEELRQRLEPKGGTLGYSLYQQDERLIRLAGEHVALSVQAMAEARKLIASEARPSSVRDLDDAIFLATADDGNADYILSLDRSITTMGERYTRAYIISWHTMLRRLGYPVGVGITT